MTTTKTKKTIEQIPGTIAYVLNKHKDELFSISNPNELKRKAIEIINNNEIKNQKDKEDFISRLNKKSTNNMLSVLAAYMTGITVSDNF